MKTAISVRNVTKRFRIPVDRSTTLKYRVTHPVSTARYRELLAVDDVSFEVPEGEVDRFAETVPRIMTGAYELETGIEVEAKVGPNWADMKKLAVVRV